MLGQLIPDMRSAGDLFLHMRVCVYGCIYLARASEDAVTPLVEAKRQRRTNGANSPPRFDEVISHD